MIDVTGIKTTDILPPFTKETAAIKVQLAENAWNSKDPVRVSASYTSDSKWRNRTEFFEGTEEIIKFLTRKWEKEQDYKLKKHLWAFDDNHIAVRFIYEYRQAGTNNWFRAHGNELWEFDEQGLMKIRDMSANEYPITEAERGQFD